MRILLSAAACTVCFAIAAPTMGSQQPARGALEGVVVDDETSAPIAEAEVGLTRVAAAQPAGGALPPRPAITDNQGRFTIHSVEPGLYRASMSAEGYVRQDYGQRIADGLQGSGTVVPVTAGATVRDITIRLTPTGVVSGHVRDHAGRPAAGLDVLLLAPAYDSNGDRRLNSAGSGRTNDRGEYRIYWVTPGRYYLAAGSSRIGPAGPGGSPNESQDGDSVTFFPGVLDPEHAEPITVRPRVEMSLDLVVSRDHYQVRGFVIDAVAAHQPTNVRIEFQPPRLVTGPGFSPTLSAIPSYNPADGTFEVRGVPAGRYYVSGIVQGPGNALRRSRPVPVIVSGADVDGVAITFEASVSVPGRVRTAEGGPLPAPSVLNRPLVFLTASSGGRRLPDWLHMFPWRGAQRLTDDDG